MSVNHILQIQPLNLQYSGQVDSILWCNQDKDAPQDGQVGGDIKIMKTKETQTDGVLVILAPFFVSTLGVIFEPIIARRHTTWLVMGSAGHKESIALLNMAIVVQIISILVL